MDGYMEGGREEGEDEKRGESANGSVFSGSSCTAGIHAVLPAPVGVGMGAGRKLKRAEAR